MFLFICEGPLLELLNANRRNGERWPERATNGTNVNETGETERRTTANTKDEHNGRTNENNERPNLPKNLDAITILTHGTRSMAAKPLHSGKNEWLQNLSNENRPRSRGSPRTIL